MIDLKEIKKLSVDERILMVEAIWDSIAEDTVAEIPLTAEQEEEMARRIEIHESGKGKTYSWEEVKQQLMK